jgi:very-long-chain enoyl-CoA reductase
VGTAGKKTIKKLPSAIQIDTTTTVEDAKIQIAKAAGVRDYNRIAILDPKKQSILNNRKALLAQESSVMEMQKIMVKDLGMRKVYQFIFLPR